MLEDLTVELLELIATEVYHAQPAAGIADLRRASRTINHKLESLFAKLTFRLVTTDLSRRSLGKLQSIAAHDLYRDAVRCVRVKRLGVYQQVEVPPPLGQGLSWRRCQDGDRAAGGTCLDLTAGPVAEFADVIVKFRRCTHFHVPEGARSKHNENDEITGTDMLHVLLTTLAHEHAPRIEAFGLRLGYEDRMWCPHMPSILAQPSFQTAWSSNLRDLRINCWIRSAENLDMLFSLINSARRLQRLHLNADSSSVAGSWCDPRGFWRRLARTAGPLPLEELAIGGRKDVPEVDLLLGVLRSFGATLRSVRLSHVGFESDADDSWARVFGALAGMSLPRLESFSFFHLRGREWNRPVLFCPLRQDLESLSECPGRFAFVKIFSKKQFRTAGVMYRGEPGQVQHAFRLLQAKHHSYGDPCQQQEECPEFRKVDDGGPPLRLAPLSALFFGTPERPNRLVTVKAFFP